MTHKSHPTCIAIPFISYSPMLPKGQTNPASCGGNGPFCNYIKLKKKKKTTKERKKSVILASLWKKDAENRARLNNMLSLSLQRSVADKAGKGGFQLQQNVTFEKE